MKKQILKEAHFPSSSELAREYFTKCGLAVKKVTMKHAEKLRDFINKEIYALLLDESYQMIKKLQMSRKIKKKKFALKLYVDGSYFTEREAISFYYDDDFIIGFCGWASGCNRIPFIKGFVEWCDWMKKESK